MAMGWIHGGYTLICQCCYVKTRLKHAMEQANQVPKLEAELNALTCQ